VYRHWTAARAVDRAAHNELTQLSAARQYDLHAARTRVAATRTTVASHALGTQQKAHPFNGPLSRTTRVGRYQKGKTNLDFTEARDNQWQWHQLDHMQVCTSVQTDNHASTPPLSFLQAGCPSCRPTNSVKALKALHATKSLRQ